MGLNITPNRAYYEERKGTLHRVVTGVYVDASLGPAERRKVLIDNGARIALRLFPQAMLAGSSAFHRCPVEGHLMIATPRGAKAVDVGGAFKIYVHKSDLDLGMNREIEFVTIEDSFGEYAIKRMADEMLVIKNFMPVRGRPIQTYLNNVDLDKVVERCMRTAGGQEPFMRRIERLAIEHGMANYLKRISAFVEHAGGYRQEQRPLQTFEVYWHQTHVATLQHDGHIWGFEYEPHVQLQLSVSEKKGRGAPPSFLGSLLPEAGLRAGDSMEDNLGDFRRGHRYISNITVKGAEAQDKSIIPDILDGELKDFISPYLEFTGRSSTDLRRALADDALLDNLQRDPDNPRMSGMQAKVPGYLDREGVLHSARGRAFTHIVKIVGSNPTYSSMCSMEWFSLTVAKASGLQVEDFAIADIGGHGPSLVVERFDVRRNLNDQRMLLTEDFWSIAGMTDNRQKYAGELMNVADAIVRSSTDKGKCGRNLLAQAMFAWLTFNGDLHLKNLLLIKEAKSLQSSFDRVALAPAYDIMCTQVYPDDAKSSAIALGGTRNHTLAGFRALGAKFGIKQAEVDAMLDHLSTSIPLWARRVAENLPDPIKNHTVSARHIAQARDLFDVRCAMMISELDDARQNRRRARSSTQDSVSFSAEPDGLEVRDEHVQAERRRSGLRP